MTPLRRNIKKDYQRKNLQNPFFRQRRQKVERSWLRWLLPVLPLLIGALLWFFLAAPFWRLENVRIEGLTRVSAAGLEEIVREQAATARLGAFNQRNIFLFRSQQAADAIKEAYNFSGVQLKKSWPRTLTIKVSERPYAFIYQEGSEQYYASADGYVIQEPAVDDDGRSKYFLLENKSGSSLIRSDDRINIKAEHLAFTLELQQRLASDHDLRVEKFLVDNEQNAVKVKFQDGPQAYFNVKDDAGTQVNVLQLVKREKIKDNFSRTNYIDLRYGDRIFINPDFTNEQ